MQRIIIIFTSIILSILGTMLYIYNLLKESKNENKELKKIIESLTNEKTKVGSLTRDEIKK